MAASDETPNDNESTRNDNNLETNNVNVTIAQSTPVGTAASSPIVSQSPANANHRRQTSVLSFASSATVDNSQIFKKSFDSILESKEAKKTSNLELQYSVHLII